jgi:hypothetical protein
MSKAELGRFAVVGVPAVSFGSGINAEALSRIILAR